jgi:hypothetical protein
MDQARVRACAVVLGRKATLYLAWASSPPATRSSSAKKPKNQRDLAMTVLPGLSVLYVQYERYYNQFALCFNDFIGQIFFFASHFVRPIKEWAAYGAIWPGCAVLHKTIKIINESITLMFYPLHSSASKLN